MATPLANGKIMLKKNYCVTFVLVAVKKISIKTGTETRSGSDAVATMKICDGDNNCCETGDLDNAGNDRSKGKTDVYENSLLSGCKKVYLLNFLTVGRKSFQSLCLLVSGFAQPEWELECPASTEVQRLRVQWVASRLDKNINGAP